MFEALTPILGSRLGRTAAAALTVMVLLGACGQKGSLYLPTEPAAANRATLPETLRPSPANPTVPPAQAPTTTAPAPGSPGRMP